MKYSMWHCRAQLCFHIHKPYASVDCQLAASGIVLQNSLSPPPAFSLSFISSFLQAEWRFDPLDIWTHYTLSLSFSCSLEWQQTLLHTDWQMHLLRNSGLFLDLSFLALQSMKFCVPPFCLHKACSVISE